ncbi:MAG: hypothetical protein COA77_02540 [Thaumarchaeota archaeon]|nr:MAG: hypothetical protein COA77_02540 [Nitrososphaerota archaeon]
MNVSCSDKKSVLGFTCTGSDESHVWKFIKTKLLDMFHCGTCSMHAEKLFNGLHSMVSLGIGKPLEKEEWKTNFRNFVAEVNLVYNTALKDGRI